MTRADGLERYARDYIPLRAYERYCMRGNGAASYRYENAVTAPAVNADQPQRVPAGDGSVAFRRATRRACL